MEPEDSSVSRLWVLYNGQVVAADRNYCDWFAYRQEELAGGSLAGLVLEGRKMEEWVAWCGAGGREGEWCLSWC